MSLDLNVLWDRRQKFQYVVAAGREDKCHSVFQIFIINPTASRLKYGCPLLACFAPWDV